MLPPPSEGAAVSCRCSPALFILPQVVPRAESQCRHARTLHASVCPSCANRRGRPAAPGAAAQQQHAGGEPAPAPAGGGGAARGGTRLPAAVVAARGAAAALPPPPPAQRPRAARAPPAHGGGRPARGAGAPAAPVVLVRKGFANAAARVLWCYGGGRRRCALTGAHWSLCGWPGLPQGLAAVVQLSAHVCGGGPRLPFSPSAMPTAVGWPAAARMEASLCARGCSACCSGGGVLPCIAAAEHPASNQHGGLTLAGTATLL